MGLPVARDSVASMPFCSGVSSNGVCFIASLYQKKVNGRNHPHAIASQTVKPRTTELLGRGRGAAKHCAIFPIASLWSLPIVALRKSEPEPVRSNGNDRNALDTLRGHSVLGPGGL